MEDADLIAEQLRHTIDLLKAEIAALESELRHTRELAEQRLGLLETARLDHESRLRSLQDGVTSFKVWMSLANGGSSIMALAALAKAWFGW